MKVNFISDYLLDKKKMGHIEYNSIE